jgi:hypothetical protein
MAMFMSTIKELRLVIFMTVSLPATSYRVYRVDCRSFPDVRAVVEWGRGME